MGETGSVTSDQKPAQGSVQVFGECLPWVGSSRSANTKNAPPKRGIYLEESTPGKLRGFSRRANASSYALRLLEPILEPIIYLTLNMIHHSFG